MFTGMCVFKWNKMRRESILLQRTSVGKEPVPEDRNTHLVEHRRGWANERFNWGHINKLKYQSKPNQETWNFTCFLRVAAGFSSLFCYAYQTTMKKLGTEKMGFCVHAQPKTLCAISKKRTERQWVSGFYLILQIVLTIDWCLFWLEKTQEIFMIWYVVRRIRKYAFP